MKNSFLLYVLLILASSAWCEPAEAEQRNRMVIYEDIITQTGPEVSDEETFLMQRASDSPLSLTDDEIKSANDLVRKFEPLIQKLLTAAKLPENVASIAEKGERYEPDAMPLFHAGKVISIRAQEYIANGDTDRALDEVLALWVAASSFEKAENARLVHAYVGVHTRALALRILDAIVLQVELTREQKKRVFSLLKTNEEYNKEIIFHPRQLVYELQYNDWHSGSEEDRLRAIELLKEYADNPKEARADLGKMEGFEEFANRLDDLTKKFLLAATMERALLGKLDE